MGRSTFEGPILSGDTRFGPQRDVGYAILAQSAGFNVADVTAGSSTYGGSSGQFVVSNGIPNLPGTVYTASSTTYPASAATPTADSATNVYRGWVAYLPVNSRINNIIVDCGVAPAVSGGTAALTAAILYVSNGFTANGGTAAYASIANITAAGRQSLATLTGTQLANWQATSTDIIVGNGQPNLSQVVFTLDLNGTDLDTATALAGTLYFTIQYTQADGNIGTLTTYPYGNLD